MTVDVVTAQSVGDDAVASVIRRGAARLHAAQSTTPALVTRIDKGVLVAAARDGGRPKGGRAGVRREGTEVAPVARSRGDRSTKITLYSFVRACETGFVETEV